MLLGIQRLYASLDPNITIRGETTLPDPARIMFKHIDYLQWEKWAPINWHVVTSVWPGIGEQYLPLARS